MLLDRDVFRNSVFARDNNLCVICGKPGQDAHHIMERRLFSDGGYYLDNGATVCSEHHIQAEQTVLSCEEIRNAAGITNLILPPHLYSDERYDKWGNVFLPNGMRLRGELFHDESVQKVLTPVLNQFTKYVKYPRTWHLPWSPGQTKDDRVLPSTDIFKDQQVVVTVKMDGENTTLYNDYMHARSIDSHSDETRHWMLNFHAQHGWQIPEGYRVCGENLHVKHSIHYENLSCYFQMFSIWNDVGYCFSWDETKEWASLLGFELVPVIYEGVYDEDKIKKLYSPRFGENEMEGYVVRLANGFNYHDFRKSVGKYVRSGHVATSHHWRREKKILNQLKGEGK